MATLKDKYSTYEEENLGKDNYSMFAGGGSPSATPISKKNFVINVCATDGDSGKFTQAALPGAEYYGENTTTKSANIFPKSGDKFENQAVDAAFAFGSNEAWHFRCIVAGKWRIK